jgi:hypothetical protein
MVANNQQQVSGQIASKLGKGQKTDRGLVQMISDKAAHGISDIQAAMTFRLEDFIVDKIGEALDSTLEKVEHKIGQTFDTAVDSASLAATNELAYMRSHPKVNPNFGSSFFAGMAEGTSGMNESEQANALHQARTASRTGIDGNKLNPNIRNPNRSGVADNNFATDGWDTGDTFSNQAIPTRNTSVAGPAETETAESNFQPYEPEVEEPLATSETLKADIQQKRKEILGGKAAGEKKTGMGAEIAGSISGTIHERSQYQKILKKDQENLATKRAAAIAGGQTVTGGSFKQGIMRRVAIRLGLRVVDRYASAIGRKLQKNIKELNFWGMYYALGFAVIKDLIDAGQLLYGDAGLTGMVATGVLSIIISYILFAQGTFLRRQILKLLFYGYKYVICWLLEWIPIIGFFPASTVGILLMIYDAYQIRRKQLAALKALEEQVKAIQKLERRGKEIPEAKLQKLSRKLDDINKIANS